MRVKISIYDMSMILPIINDQQKKNTTNTRIAFTNLLIITSIEGMNFTISPNIYTAVIFEH